MTEQSKLYVHKKSGSTIAAVETDDGNIHYRRLENPADGFIIRKEMFGRLIKDNGYVASGSADAEVATTAQAAAATGTATTTTTAATTSSEEESEKSKRSGRR